MVPPTHNGAPVPEPLDEDDPLDPEEDDPLDPEDEDEPEAAELPKARLKVWITKSRGNLSSPLMNAVI